MSILVGFGILGFILSLVALFNINQEHKEALKQEAMLEDQLVKLGEYTNTLAKEYKDLRYRVKNMEARQQSLNATGSVELGQDKCN